MKRGFVMSAMLLITLGFLFDWRLSAAIDGEKAASALAAVEASEVAKLTARIELLEKRVASLEHTEPLIRQADARASELNSPPASPAVPQQFVPTAEDDGETQTTNGHKWKFRLLGNSKPQSANRR